MIILYDGRWTTKLMNCNLLCNHVSDFVINERYEADFNSFIRHRRVMILLLLSSGLFIVYSIIKMGTTTSPSFNKIGSKTKKFYYRTVFA